MSASVEMRAILREEITAGVKNIEAELERLRASGKGAGEGIAQGMNTALPTVRGVTDAMGAQTAQLRAQRDAMGTDEWKKYSEEQKRLREEIQRMNGTTENGAEKFAMFAGKAFIAYQAIQQMASGISSLVDAASAYDSLNMRLKATEGSATVASMRMREMVQISKQPGIGVEQATSAYSQLRSMNVIGSESIRVINGIAKANAAMGGGAEEFGRAMNQITQAYGKQKLMGEELMTLSESLPNFRGIVQQAFGGMSMDAINAKYSINEIMIKIAEVAEKLPAAGDTIKNASDNISDGWKRLLANLANTQAIKSASTAIADLLEVMNSGIEAAKDRDTRFAQVLATHGQKVSTNSLLRVAQFRTLSEEERKWVDSGKANTAVYASNLVEQEKIDAKQRENNKKREDDARNARTKIQEELKKTDSQSKIKSENEWYQKQSETFRKNILDAKELASALSELDKVHKKHIEEIEKKSHHKVDTTARDAANKESSDLVAHWADVDEHNKKEVAKAAALRKHEQELEDDDEMRRAMIRARIWTQEEKLTTKMAGYWQNYYLEVEEMREKDEERIQGYYLSIATASSSVLSNALLSEQSFFDATVEGFRNMLKQMLAELAANAAIFGALNVFSGGTASAFAGGLGGLSGLVLNSLDVGTRSLPSDGPIYAHKDEAIFPAPVSRAMNSGDWGPAMRFMGQSSTSTTTSSTTIGAVHIHMPAKANITADDIARELPRALTKVVPRKRSGGSV